MFIIGAQSLGVCLPYTYDSESSLAFLWDYRTRTQLTESLVDHILTLDQLNVGEIFLFNVDSDGSLEGMDANIVGLLNHLDIKTPLILGGGAGSPSHVQQVLSSQLIQGIVASSIFALTENTPHTLRVFCETSGISMRRP